MHIVDKYLLDKSLVLTRIPIISSVVRSLTTVHTTENPPVTLQYSTKLYIFPAVQEHKYIFLCSTVQNYIFSRAVQYKIIYFSLQYSKYLYVFSALQNKTKYFLCSTVHNYIFSMQYITKLYFFSAV